MNTLKVLGLFLKIVDAAILFFIFLRFCLTRIVGINKAKHNLPIKRPEVEKARTKSFVRLGYRLGLSPKMTRKIFKIILEFSCSQQEKIKSKF